MSFSDRFRINKDSSGRVRFNVAISDDVVITIVGTDADLDSLFAQYRAYVSDRDDAVVPTAPHPVVELASPAPPTEAELQALADDRARRVAERERSKEKARLKRVAKEREERAKSRRKSK